MLVYVIELEVIGFAFHNVFIKGTIPHLSVWVNRKEAVEYLKSLGFTRKDGTFYLEDETIAKDGIYATIVNKKLTGELPNNADF